MCELVEGGDVVDGRASELVGILVGVKEAARQEGKKEWGRDVSLGRGEEREGEG